MNRTWDSAVLGLVLATAAAHFSAAMGAESAPGLGPARDTISSAAPAPPAWWSFQPVKNVPLPAVRDAAWVRTPVDRFILGKLEAHSLRPAPPAEPAALLRRAYFDLIGLPPAPEELRAFQADPSSLAFSRVVDRLLASPRYGERWGRHWMDVARYADTAGDNADYPVPEVRLYRDYIIDSFNADKPYDQFVREQLAGDILAKQGARPEPVEGSRERFAEQIVATGFLALSRRYATAPFEFMHLTIEDAIETTGRAFLGLTLRCARCHDHKFDPVTKEDYYAMYGFFASTRFPYAGSEEFQSKKAARSGFVPLWPADETKEQLAENQRRVEELRAAVTRLEKETEAARSNAHLKKSLGAQLKTAQTELKRRDRFGAPPGVPVAYAVAEGKPIDESVHVRGEPAERGPVVPRRAPCSLGMPADLSIPAAASGRLQLADWIGSPANPLTARVMANRIWQHHFGKGLVATPSNFGLRGDPPTHPELLDYLARFFVGSGWSVKAMHRLILNSASWQQGDSAGADAATLDPANQLHWRHDRLRLEAESIRDAMRAVAGTLNLTRPGPHSFPKFDDWDWTQHNPFKAVYESDHRSVYLMTQRIQRHPFLALFDAPDANTSTDVRPDSTVPLQALYLMNHAFVQTQASALARRVVAGAVLEADRVRLACELAWSRGPTDSELARARRFLADCRQAIAAAARTQAQGETGLDLEQEAWTGYARVLLTANEFFYVD